MMAEIRRSVMAVPRSRFVAPILLAGGVAFPFLWAVLHRELPRPPAWSSPSG
jgi:hypothetical protein